MVKSSQPVVNMVCCTRCGLCVEACPCHAIQLTDQGHVFTCSDSCRHDDISVEDCGGWCLCEQACPSGAIDCVFDIVLDERCVMPQDDGAEKLDSA